jgi:hypothetical protein
MAKKTRAKRSVIPPDLDPEEVGDEIETEEDANGDIDLLVLSPRIRTKEEALAKANIDLKEFSIKKVRVRSYEMGMKVEAVAGKVKITKAAAIVPLFAVSVELERRTGWDVEEFRKRVMDDFKLAAPKRLVKAPKIVENEERLAEIAIYDAHIGKLGWNNEVLENYDVEIARSRYLSCFDRLLNDISAFKPNRYLYVIGNDMLHVDTGRNTTTRGTPQDVDGRWQRSYLYAQRLIVDCASRMRELAPVDILVIPGNHDEERLFCLGNAIEMRFHADEHIRVFNEPILQKVYQWGEVFLGFEHGNQIASGDKRKLAPQGYASRYPKEWGTSRWHEIHHGHIHTEKEFHTRTASDTIGDTIFRSLPSISGTDKWHFEKGYMSPTSCEAHLYDNRCRRGYFAWSPE